MILFYFQCEVTRASYIRSVISNKFCWHPLNDHNNYNHKGKKFTPLVPSLFNSLKDFLINRIIHRSRPKLEFRVSGTRKILYSTEGLVTDWVRPETSVPLSGGDRSLGFSTNIGTWTDTERGGSRTYFVVDSYTRSSGSDEEGIVSWMRQWVVEDWTGRRKAPLPRPECSRLEFF